MRAPHPVAGGALEVTALRARGQVSAEEPPTIPRLAPTPLARSPGTRSPPGRGLQGGTCPQRTRLAVHSTHLTGGQHGGTTTKAEVGRSNRLGGTVLLGTLLDSPKVSPQQAGPRPEPGDDTPCRRPDHTVDDACWVPPSKGPAGRRAPRRGAMWAARNRQEAARARKARGRGCCAARCDLCRASVAVSPPPRWHHGCAPPPAEEPTAHPAQLPATPGSQQAPRLFTEAPTLEPEQTIALASAAETVMGTSFRYARTLPGAALCWGEDNTGALGIGHLRPAKSPQLVTGFNAPYGNSTRDRPTCAH